MIKDFITYINEGLFDRNQSEFAIKKTDNGIEQIYIPKTRKELDNYIELDIEQAKKDGTYPNVNLNNIDVSELGNNDLKGLFGSENYTINPDISNWNIKYIPNKFFSGNEQIEEFTIPNIVTGIGKWAFYCCSGLTSVTIPNSVARIGEWAFDGCGSLSSITIPNSVTIIGNGAFHSCTDLTSVEIPDDITRIEDGVFAKCSSLTSVVIPNSVTIIGRSAFYECSSLMSVTIPNSVTSIGDDAFWGCSSLTSVTISENCNISIYAFPKNCKITRRDD